MEMVEKCMIGDTELEIHKLNISDSDIVIFRADMTQDDANRIMRTLRMLDIKQPVLLLQTNQFVETMKLEDLQTLIERYGANPEAEVH